MPTESTQMHLTDTRIRALRPPADRDVEYSDRTVRGLRLAIYPSGLRVFRLRRRHAGRKWSARLGEWPALTADAARDRAWDMIRLLDQGIDPCSAQAAGAAELTLAEFAERHYLPDAARRKKSFRCDRDKLVNEIIPKLGACRLSDVTTQQVAEHLAAVERRASGTTSNRHRALLSSLFGMAEDLGHIADGQNPVARTRKYRENPPRDRYLDAAELRALQAALEQCPNRLYVLAIQFLLYTGLRMGEALGLEWSDVKLDEGIARLGDTKNGKARDAVLNEQAVGVLKQLEAHRRPGNGHVFPGRGGTGHLTAVRKTWRRACEAAGISNCHRHDLRHTFASWLVNEGIPIYEVSALLGHCDVSVTQRYSHLNRARLRDASACVGRSLEAAAK